MTRTRLGSRVCLGTVAVVLIGNASLLATAQDEPSRDRLTMLYADPAQPTSMGIRKEFTMGFLAPHSDVFHMVERFSRPTSGVLEIAITVDDAKALSKPMNMLIRYLSSDDDTFIEDFCNENNRNISDADGFIQTILTPKKGYGWDLPD
jgi:hypothetical protein